MYEWKHHDAGDFDIETLDCSSHSPGLVDSHGHSIGSEYFQGWQSAYQYVYDVLSGKRTASRTEIAMCERFCADLNRCDIEFDHEQVDLAIEVINLLRHPKGPISGTPFYLMRWMVFILANIFGWYYTDKAFPASLNGQRRFQRANVFVPRGNSKTVLAAGVAIVNTIFTENGSPICTTSATTTKQARIAYDDIAQMIKTSPGLRKRFDVMEKDIRFSLNNGKIIYTSKQADSLNGHRIVTGLIDEWAAHPNGDVTEAIATGMGSSLNPILFAISTAYNTLGYGYEQFQYTNEIVTGQVKHDRTFAAIYAADEELAESLYDKDVDLSHEERLRVFEMANPALNHAVNPDSLESAYLDSLRSESAKANFLIKHLNIFYTFEADSVVSQTDLDACRDLDQKIEDFEGRDCYIGIDLAAVNDLSTSVLIFPKDNGGVAAFSRSYLPVSAMRGLKQSIHDRYIQAKADGELVLTESEVTDFNAITSDLNEFTQRFNVKGISIDPNAGGTRFAFEYNEGDPEVPIVTVQQGFGLSESIVMLQQLVKQGLFTTNDKTLEWAIMNTQTVEGRYGDLRLTKSVIDPTKKIDPAVALVIGLSQTILQENTDSYYETHDLRVI